MYPSKYGSNDIDGRINYSSVIQNKKYSRPMTSYSSRDNTNPSNRRQYRPVTAIPCTQSVRTSISPRNLHTSENYKSRNPKQYERIQLEESSVFSSEKSSPVESNSRYQNINIKTERKNLSNNHSFIRNDHKKTNLFDNNKIENQEENLNKFYPSSQYVSGKYDLTNSCHSNDHNNLLNDREKNIKEKSCHCNSSNTHENKKKGIKQSCTQCQCHSSNKTCLCSKKFDSYENTNYDSDKYNTKHFDKNKNKLDKNKNDINSYNDYYDKHTGGKSKNDDVSYNNYYDKYINGRSKNDDDLNNNYDRYTDEKSKCDNKNDSDVYHNYYDRYKDEKYKFEKSKNDRDPNKNFYDRCTGGKNKLEKNKNDVDLNNNHYDEKSISESKTDNSVNKNYSVGKCDINDNIICDKNTDVDKSKEIISGKSECNIKPIPIKRKTKYTTVQQSRVKTKESAVKKFDRIVDEELRRRRDSLHVMLEPTTSDPEILQAVDCYIRAENVDTFTGAVRAAEEAAARALPDQAEEAAVQGARGFQAEVIDVIEEQLPGWIPIKVIGYVGITKPKRPVKTMN